MVSEPARNSWSQQIEAPSRMTVVESSAERFHSVLCDEQRIDDTI
jgi:hypothetical protein